MIVVSNTTPIHYLVLIGEVELLARLFSEVNTTRVILDELSHPSAPEPVRNWAQQPPQWIKVSDDGPLSDAGNLDIGELSALALAKRVTADLLLLDDSDARKAATNLGIPTAGTLGVLLRAHEIEAVDLVAAIKNLRKTNFYISQSTLEHIAKLANVSARDFTA